MTISYCNILITHLPTLFFLVSAVKDWTYAFPKEFLNNYCYIHSTFIVPNNDKLEDESIYLNNGLGSYQTGNTDEVVFQSYYQWITLLLFIQGKNLTSTRKL